LVFRTCGVQQLEDVCALKGIWSDVNISNVHYVSPNLLKPKITCFNNIVRFLRNIIKKIFFKEKRAKNLRDKDYNNFGVRDYFPFQPIDIQFINHLEKLLKNNFYEIIQVEHTPFLNLIHILPGKSKKIFVQVENRYKILEDYFFKNKLDSLFSKYIVENAKNTEVNLLNKYDYVLSLSKNDKVELKHLLPENKIFISPFPILDSLHSVLDSNDFRAEKLVFLGSQEHRPNEDAIVWFVENIYPLVELKLYVTGNWKNDFIKKYPSVVFTGFIQDLSDILRNSIVISPIRLGGGGIRAKVIQAMAMKCPVISTELSCIGIENVEHKKNIYLANTINEFKDAIYELHSDKDLCSFMISNAYDVVQEFYSEKAVGEIRKNIYLKISSQV
jgi:glycosyltransferase involved in cell wall biosynthesis